MTDEAMPATPADDGLAEQERAQVAYLRELRVLEEAGERAPLAFGPFSGFQLLMLGGKAVTAPDLARYRVIFDDLAGQLAPMVTVDEVQGATLAETTEAIRGLIAREQAGERGLVVIGPFSALMVIGMLQTMSRHPDLSPEQHESVLTLVRCFEPLFAGTPGEALVKAGYDPGQDR